LQQSFASFSSEKKKKDDITDTNDHHFFSTSVYRRFGDERGSIIFIFIISRVYTPSYSFCRLSRLAFTPSFRSLHDNNRKQRGKLFKNVDFCV